jgi:hypothetical protein
MGARFVARASLLITLCVATAGITAAQGPAPLPTGIDWPEPVVGPGLLTRTVLPFEGGLVAVGSEQDGVTIRAAAWWSADGNAWERTILDGPKRGYTEMRDVVAIPGGLVAMGPRGKDPCTGSGEGEVRCEPTSIAVWRSIDGRTWERVDTRGTIGRGAVSTLAAGPLGVLAVGVDRHGVATTWRSPDGMAWTATSLTGDGFDRAQVNDVAVAPDGWVMVGSTGGHDVPPGGVSTPNGSAGAAWTSADGISWQPAAVDGTGEQVELRSVFVGADGLTAVGSLTGGKEATMWTSVDGTAWTLQVPGPDATNPPIPSASDGRTIIAMSYRFDDAGGIDWWASTDGVTWTELAPSGEVATAPRWEDSDGVALVDGTLVVLGQSGEDERIWLGRLHPPRPV